MVDSRVLYIKARAGVGRPNSGLGLLMRGRSDQMMQLTDYIAPISVK